jgi:hypothetical protein
MPFAEPPRPPSPFTVERVISAWMQARDTIAADDAFATDEHAAIAQALLAADPTQLAPDDLIRRLISAIVWTEYRAEDIRDLRRRLGESGVRYGRAAENMRQTLLTIMQLLGLRRFDEGALKKALIVRARPSVVILDVDALPDEYVRVVREPERGRIGDDLREGVVIDGATLSNAADTVQLRDL